MHSPEIEVFLARLYTDPMLLKDFLQHPEMELHKQQVSSGACVFLKEIDLQGLQLAAISYQYKRIQYSRKQRMCLEPVERFFRACWELLIG